jgi:autotransporter translocation and assembly factor TamB
MKLRVILMGVLCAAMAMAADVSGKWAAETPGRQGGAPTTTTFTFKADGAKLTGTIQGARGPAAEIADGKVDGNNISFSITREIQGQSMKMMYKGTVSGDEIKMSMTREGGEGQAREMTAKRVKE